MLYKNSLKYTERKTGIIYYDCTNYFFIMKSEFKARPVYLQRSDRIEAHFMTCFIALILYLFLEKELGEKYTCPQRIAALEEMNFYRAAPEGYLPAYTRTDLTDALHEASGFRTDYEIISNAQMKKFLNLQKNRKRYAKIYN